MHTRQLYGRASPWLLHLARRLVDFLSHRFATGIGGKRPGGRPAACPRMREPLAVILPQVAENKPGHGSTPWRAIEQRISTSPCRS